MCIMHYLEYFIRTFKYSKIFSNILKYFHKPQGRLDGAICEYNEEDKMNYLKVIII